MWYRTYMVNVVAVTNILYHLHQLCNNDDTLVAYGKTDEILGGHVRVLRTQQQYCVIKCKGHPCTGTEALYRPYGP